jgi:hypothetical protein
MGLMLEAQYDSSLTEDNSIRLLKQLSSPILIAHDAQDHTVSINDSKQQALEHDNVDLLATHGLGHHRILKDSRRLFIKIEIAELKAVRAKKREDQAAPRKRIRYKEFRNVMSLNLQLIV